MPSGGDFKCDALRHFPATWTTRALIFALLCASLRPLRFMQWLFLFFLATGCASLILTARFGILTPCRAVYGRLWPAHDSNSVALDEIFTRRSEISSRNRGRSDDSSHRVNHNIRAREVRVIDPDGEQIGVMTPEEAREKAEEYGLDLVEVAPKARPPVCRIMDYGKYQYEQSKKKSASRSNRVQLKTVQFRPNTDDHDLQVKLKRAKKFIDKGNQVKFVMRMRGRERAYTDRLVDQLNQMLEDFQEDYETNIKVVSRPRAEGWRIQAIVEPDSSS